MTRAVPMPKNAPARGVFIAFEGGEGAGKSTQVKALAAGLRAGGQTVLVTREPGGTPAAEIMRAVALDPEHTGLDPRAEALLFAAARADHVARVIRPALSQGQVVVCDRYIDSSVAYQGVGRGLGVTRIEQLSLWATDGLRPDLTIVLDVDPVLGRQRTAAAPDRLESESGEFHAGVRAAFLERAAADPEHYLILDADRSPEELAARVAVRVATLLPARS